MSSAVNNDYKAKIEARHKRLTYQELRKQLSRNGYGKYTSIETEMVVSEALLSLSGACKNILLLFLLKRRLKFKKGKIPMCINPDKICMTYKELQSPPFNYPSETIRRCLKILLVRGFIKIVHQGGAYKKDKSIYGISENWCLWKPGMDFSQKIKDVRRGYQGKSLGAVKKNNLNT